MTTPIPGSTSPQGPPAPERTDEQLVVLVRTADEEALSTLYRRYVQGIYRFVLAQVRDHDTAEDLTSETFARMLRGLDGFRGDASFKNWLYQIARNAVRNHRRSAPYRLTVPLDALLPMAAPVARDAQDEDEGADGAAASVQAMLAPLPPRYRQVLELRFLSGLSVQETADRLAITVANAKVLQLRALQKMARFAEGWARPAPAAPAGSLSLIEESHRGPEPHA
jgi:RNA polymerase sigma-70 factor (ECF subfamily)